MALQQHVTWAQSEARTLPWVIHRFAVLRLLSYAGNQVLTIYALANRSTIVIKNY